MATNTKPGKPNLDHPVFARVKEAFPSAEFTGTEFRGASTLIVRPADLHRVMTFLRDDASCRFDFLSDVVALDYLNYPSETPGRFAVAYVLSSTERNDRFHVKTYVDPQRATDGIEEDPALYVDSACDLWPGAEWMEREVFERAFRVYWDAGYQIHVHVNGDAGLDRVLDVLEANLRRNPRYDHRTVLVHFAVSALDQIGRIKALGAIVSS